MPTRIIPRKRFLGWLFNTIAPLSLVPGNYVIAGTWQFDDPDHARFTASATTIPEVSFVNEREKSSPGPVLTFPDQVFPFLNDGAFGPNLRLVPEASTYILFGLGALGVMVWRRRKAR